MNELTYEDLKKVIVDLEIEKARICVERDQLKYEISQHQMYGLARCSQLQQNNDSNNSINNKSIEANSSLKQQQLDHDINNIAHNNDAKRIAPSSTSTIFEFYEVNADILSLTSAAGSFAEFDKSVDNFDSCFISPCVTWEYHHHQHHNQQQEPLLSGIDSIADFSFPSGAFIDVVSTSSISLLSGPQYDRYHISQFLNVHGNVNSRACFVTIRTIEPWPDDCNLVKYIIHLANKKRAGKKIRRYISTIIRLRKQKEIMSDLCSPGGTKVHSSDTDNSTKTSIFRYFKRSPKKDSDNNNNRFQLFKSSTKSIESTDSIDSKTSISTTDNNNNDNNHLKSNNNSSSSNDSTDTNSISNNNNNNNNNNNGNNTEPSENIKRIAKALRRAIQLGVPAESPAISQSMVILQDANCLHLLTAEDTCHIYFDDDDLNKPPPKPPRIEINAKSSKNKNNNDNDIKVITKGKVFVRDKCFCLITSEANDGVIFHALQAIVDAERNSNNNSVIDSRSNFLSYLYSNLTNDSNMLSNTIENYLHYFIVPKVMPDSNDSIIAVMLSIIDARVIMKIMNLLLTEKSIIIIGSNPGVVSCITLGISTLIQPFQWSGALLPLVPNSGKELFGAPVPFILGTITTTLTMEDINSNTAVLNIYDPVIDRKPNTKTKIDANQDVRLSSINQTEAWFTRLPELQSTMPICDSLDQQLRYSRRSLISSKIDRRKVQNSELFSANEYLFDLCFFNSMTPSDLQAVHQAMFAIKEHNQQYLGSLSQPSAWKSCLRYNKVSNQTEFSPESFMRPIKDIVEFQENLCQTQIFVDYFTKIRNEYISHKRQR